MAWSLVNMDNPIVYLVHGMLFNEAVIHAAEKLSAVLRDCTFVM